MYALPSYSQFQRTYAWKHQRSVLKEIIFAAPFLEEIEHVGCESQNLVDAIWDTERVKLVSSMTLEGATLSLGMCEKLMANPPTLTSLTISRVNSNNSRQQVAAMKSVLFASRDTLKTLSLQHVYVRLEEEIPAFTQLKQLNVTTWCKNVPDMFPTLSEDHFPKLKNIQLE